MQNAPTDIYPNKSVAFPHSWYLSPETDYNDIGYYDGKTFFSMEIVESCASKCGFCASGFKDKGRDFQDPQAIPNLDLYLIMNLPGEAPDSFSQTVDFIGNMHHFAQQRGLQGRMRISIPNFFPKAWTPFQYAASGGIDTYHGRIDVVQEALGHQIKISTMRDNVDLLSQNIMARGGPEAGRLMIEVYQMLKQREQETGIYATDTFEDWRAALQTLQIDEQDYFASRSSDKPMPWQHIHLNGNIRTGLLKRYWETFRNRRSVFILD